MPSSSPNVFENAIKAHRGEADVALENIEFEKLVAKPYKEGVSKLNCFYSTTKPLELLKVLLEFFNGKGEVTFNPTHMKIKVKAVSEENQSLELIARISTVKEDLFAVEFVKLNGDCFMFPNMVKSAKEFFGGHVNATL